MSSNGSILINCREAAFLALLHSLRGEKFIADYLETWFMQDSPHANDYHLAQQIAYGSAQMAYSLDYLAAQVSEKKKVHLKLKEKALLRTALYQIHFLDRIPHYAVIDESVKIAKKYFHKYFVSYLNAILRKAADYSFKIPQGADVSSLSLRYSFPPKFIEDLSSRYGLQATLKVLEASNKPAMTMARVRNPTDLSDAYIPVIKEPVPVVSVPSIQMMKIAASSDFYIQNVTPAFLIGSLSKNLSLAPEKILDMCAAPGGKSLAVHDFFPKSMLYANDVSDEKIQKLRENFKKYDVPALISSGEGETLTFDTKFDLIILDVPCSNSGVLNKRPEARWRLNDDHYHALENIQWALLENALKLIKPQGEIWYMTCSILPHENEKMVEKAVQQLNLKIKESHLILPNEEGWDGGFACSLLNL